MKYMDPYLRNRDKEMHRILSTISVNSQVSLKAPRIKDFCFVVPVIKLVHSCGFDYRLFADDCKSVSPSGFLL